MSNQKSRKEYVTSIPLGMRFGSQQNQKDAKPLSELSSGDTKPERTNSTNMREGSNQADNHSAGNNLETCVWYACGECERSGLRKHLGDRKYDGIACKCFAYTRSVKK